MAVSSLNTTEHFIPKNNRDNNALANAAASGGGGGDAKALAAARRAEEVSVIYYLSRNGRLEHPHFIQVPISSPHGGLYLKDLMNRLNILRGNGMATRYSWSSKRSYKSSGYVWQDLLEDDLIHPTTTSHDYVLKGSEIILYDSQTASLHDDTQRDISSNSWKTTRNQFNLSLSSFGENSWNHYPKEQQLKCRCESNRELGRKSADAATQTKEEEEYIVELSREELASPPPPCNSSSEGLSESGGVNDCLDRTVKNGSSSCWRIKAVQVLIDRRGSLDSSGKGFGVDGKKKLLCFGRIIRAGIIKLLQNKRRL